MLLSEASRQRQVFGTDGNHCQTLFQERKDDAKFVAQMLYTLKAEMDKEHKEIETLRKLQVEYSEIQVITDQIQCEIRVIT